VDTEKELKNKTMPTDIDSYKIKYKGGVNSATPYAPFKMAAADHNNSPIEKNYGTPANRGIAAFGTKDSEFLNQETTDAGTSLNFGSAVGGSPNKLDGILNPFAGQGAMRVATGNTPEPTIPPHGDEAHTGGTEGEAIPTEVEQPVGQEVGAAGQQTSGSRQRLMDRIKQMGWKGFAMGGNNRSFLGF